MGGRNCGGLIKGAGRGLLRPAGLNLSVPAEFISKAFESTADRTRAFALVDLAVNALGLLMQLFGTSRLVTRFGVTFALVFNPLVMIAAFLAVAVSPMLAVLLTVQVVRRASENAVARPAREMLFTVVDQESKFKAKSVIDTAVYRFGDLSAAWGQAGLAAAGLGVVGVAAVGVGLSVVWAGVALSLGSRAERIALPASEPAPKSQPA